MKQHLTMESERIKGRVTIEVQVFLVLLTLVVLPSVTAQPAQDNRVLCPHDHSVFGYTSLNAINEDIQNEFRRIEFDPRNLPIESGYTYTLCPYTTFHGVERLEPKLNRSRFVCGNRGLSSDNCVIEGGNYPVVIWENDDTTKWRMELVQFEGLTFRDNRQYSVAAFAGPQTTAEFRDCHWRGNSGESAIHISNDVQLEGHLTPDTFSRRLKEQPAREGNTALEFQSLVEFRKIHMHNRGGDNVGIGQEVVVESDDIRHLEKNPASRSRPPGMKVHIYDSTFSHGSSNFTTPNDIGYRAIFAAYASVVLNNVKVQDNNGGVLINLIGGEAKIQDSVFARNNMTMLLRLMNSAKVEIEQSMFTSNRVRASVATEESILSVDRSGFLENDSVFGEIMSFASDVRLLRLCIEGGSSSIPMFLDDTTIYELGGLYGSGQRVSGKCGIDENDSGSRLGLFVEDDGGDCFEEDHSCTGRCLPFTKDQCELDFFSKAPSAAPTPPIKHQSDIDMDGFHPSDDGNADDHLHVAKVKTISAADSADTHVLLSTSFLCVLGMLLLL